MNENGNSYIVLEIQANGEQVACLSSTYKTQSDALSKFYQTMVSATQSSVEKHTVVIMNEIGQVRKIETVYHEVEA